MKRTVTPECGYWARIFLRSELWRDEVNPLLIRDLLFSDSSVSLSPTVLSSSESWKDGSGALRPESLRSCQADREEVAGSAVLFLFGAGDLKTVSASLSTLSDTDFNSEEKVSPILRISSSTAFSVL